MSPLYAASVAGALPSTCITWFQAEQACRLSGKRLLTNQEWQAAAAGTPDTGVDDQVASCNHYDDDGAVATPTGSRASCISKWGVFDMVGNAAEWVADWGPLSTACPGWETAGWGFSSGDMMCLAGASTGAGPGALVRGGDSSGEGEEGVFSIFSTFPGVFMVTTGFRCGGLPR
jgi:formylglycine-generating enzyme required for sulfatase activity